MRALLIAEKPSLMNTIRAVYQQNRNRIGYEIDFKAQAGHLLGLKMPDEINPALKKWSLENLPMEVPFRYKVLNGKQNMLRDIKTAIQSGNYDFIIHAGDPEQEGEILIRETLDYCNNRLPVKRFWSNDQTEGEVLAALMNLKDDAEFDKLSEAGFVRQHTDYNYGMNLTEGMSVKSGATIRMGRVKAAIIKAVVDREKEIEEFVPSSTYQRAFLYEEKQFVDASETYDTEELTAQSMKVIPTSAQVISCKTEEKKTKAPKLYKLSTLQTDAFNKIRMSPDITLSTLQSLYEKKLVSYPRTACEYISSHEDVLGIYQSIFGMIPELQAHQLSPRSEQAIRADKAYCNDKAIASEGHTGIIPTGKRPSGLSDAEKKLYNLIIRRFASICLQPKEVQNTTITAKDENGYEYTYKGTKDISPTFEYVLNPSYRPKQFDFYPTPGTVLDPVSFQPKEIEKKAPVRFNEGSFIKFLSNPKDYKDEDGHSVKYTIGMESTRAAIIKECIACNYLTKEKGIYAPTEFAKTVCRDYGDLPVFAIDTSAQWESTLEQVRQGEAHADEVEAGFNAQLREMIADIKERSVTKLPYHASKTGAVSTEGAKAASIVGKCPCCANGEIRENSKAFGCSNWNGDPKCDFTIWKNTCGATLTKTDVRKLIEGKTITKTCHKKDGGTYQAQLAYDFENGKVDFAKNIERERQHSR